MVKVIVQWDDKKAELLMEVDDEVSFLRFQLYSLTDVAPEHQLVTGIGSTPLTDSTNLAKAGIRDGQVITVTRKSAIAPATTTAAAATPKAVPSGPIPSPQEWQSACSRVYLGDDAAQQPGANVNGRPICIGCAGNCHMPQTVQPRLSRDAMSCQCGTAGHFCLFAARAARGHERVTGALRDQLVGMTTTFAAQQIAQMQAPRMQAMARRVQNCVASYEYDDPELQRQALAVIPVAVLEERARKHCEVATDDAKDYRNSLLVMLLIWFKQEFFKWVNQPPCDRCQGATDGIGGSAPTPEEAKYRAGMVEMYKCKNMSCGAITRFPRYNHAGKLLQTRRGRCGEWAQCFTLCCRAMKFEARFVNDWTDHVWTEVYSESSGRWQHCDSCETSRDSPLLYESGWGKKLSYVVAVSGEEIVDVTQRYTHKWTEVLTRRTDCAEDWLSTMIMGLNANKLFKLTPARRAILAERAKVEQAEFKRNRELDPQVKDALLKEEEKIGRLTGSVEWRSARGELGDTTRPLPTDAAIALQPAASNASTSITSPVEEKKRPPATTTTTTSDGITGAPGSCTVPPVNTTATSTSTPVTPSKPATAATSTSTPPPTAATATTSALSASAQKAQLQAAAKATILKYFTMVSKGCGSAPCSTSSCNSNPAFVRPAAAKEQMALALQLATKNGVEALCPNLTVTDTTSRVAPT